MKSVIKAIILLSIILIYEYVMQFVSPIIANELAMSQMQNTIDSSLKIQIYTYISNYSWAIILVIALVMFYKELLILIDKIIDDIEGE